MTLLPSIVEASLTVVNPALQLELNIDRPGGDYRGFDLVRADPKECMQACTADGRCKSYTYVRPGVQGPRPRCWLKNNVPTPISSSCCTSGVKGGLEPQIDRPGSDMTGLPQPTGGANGCRARCLNNPNCRAFTYVNAGVQGPVPRCYLKNRIPAAVPSSCCTSGAVR
jgi:hypothetical protein